MKHILLLLLLCTCFLVRSQNEFTEIKKEVTTWYETTMSLAAVKSKAPKSIDFIKFHYAINGVIDKGKLAQGTIAKFYDTSAEAPQLLLEGKVNYMADRLVVKGVKYITSPTGINKLYGTFFVYNMDDFTMCYKTKKAGALRIQRDKPLYFEGYYRDRSAILRMNEVNNIYLDRKKVEGDFFVYLSAPIPNISVNDDDPYDIPSILLQINDGVTMRWKDGTVFKGNVKPVSEDGSIGFILLDGQRFNPVNGKKSITLRHEDGNIVISEDYNGDENQLANKTWLIKDDGTLSEVDYWNWEKLYKLCYLSKWTFQNGNYLEGFPKLTIEKTDITGVININESIPTGIFKYTNGDRFEGNLSKSQGSVPYFYDGITYFKDGTKETDDWLKKFKLTNEQWGSVVICENPSAARGLARQFERRNNYPEYEYGGIIQYFDPSDEEMMPILFSVVKIIYDKAKDCYTIKNKDKVRLKFGVDRNGYRMWEIVYGHGKPTYINKFTWYSNGVIESIKSYSYDTKKLYLSCYFFSDGKLRSAYQYGRGNNGENVIRKSKESHPTFGGYTCKLYDLNGNYERSIEWNIGVGESLFGESYDLKMAPAHLKFSKLKPTNM